MNKEEREQEFMLSLFNYVINRFNLVKIIKNDIIKPIDDIMERL